MNSKTNSVWARRNLLTRLYLLLASFSASLFFVAQVPVDSNPSARLPMLMNGSASRPYVCRLLLPKLLAILNWATPSRLQTWATEVSQSNPALHSLFDAFKYDPRFAWGYFLYFILMVASLFGACALLVEISRECFPTLPGLGFLASTISLALTYPLIHYFMYAYDPFSPVFFLVGLYLMCREQWGLYLCFFGLSLVHKETMMLLALLYFIHFGLRKGALLRPEFLGKFGLQLGLYLCVTRLISSHYANNARDGQYYLPENWEHLLKPSFSLAEALGLSLFFAAVFHRWSEKPALLRDVLPLGISLFALWLPFGYSAVYDDRIHFEFRIFLEVLFPITLLASQTVYSLAQELVEVVRHGEAG